MNLIKILLLLLLTAPAFGANKDLMDRYKVFTDAVPCHTVITSADRSQTDNARVAGAENSYHLTGQALDIAFINCRVDLNNLGKIARRYFNGVIVYDRHIHVDTRETPYYGKGKY